VEPRWRRLEPDERRRQILACAVRLFGERPYPEVSTTDIARAAGVARGLVNHYFGTKKGLYLEVVRTLVTIPPFLPEELPTGDLAARVDAGVTWFLDAVSRHSRPWLAAMAAGAGGHDAQVAAVLAEADEVTADTLLRLVGPDAAGPVGGADRPELRAVFRAYGGMAKAAAREWLERGCLDRGQVHTLLTTSLVGLVTDVSPRIGTDRNAGPDRQLPTSSG
jgi:AcrR family transcriptional regulator